MNHTRYIKSHTDQIQKCWRAACPLRATCWTPLLFPVFWENSWMLRTRFSEKTGVVNQLWHITRFSSWLCCYGNKGADRACQHTHTHTHQIRQCRRWTQVLYVSTGCTQKWATEFVCNLNSNGGRRDRKKRPIKTDMSWHRCVQLNKTDSQGERTALQSKKKKRKKSQNVRRLYSETKRWDDGETRDGARRTAFLEDE